ncbi:hypothetical protein RUM43_003581 [Polyplax serrata]|uniref:Uncharacterized protein n=1 Tax=Polyplax serrata TaxID=468196 RepID=A0AAN8Q188_POLSC
MRVHMRPSLYPGQPRKSLKEGSDKILQWQKNLAAGILPQSIKGFSDSSDRASFSTKSAVSTTSPCQRKRKLKPDKGNECYNTDVRDKKVDELTGVFEGAKSVVKCLFKY